MYALHCSQLRSVQIRGHGISFAGETARTASD